MRNAVRMLFGVLIDGVSVTKEGLVSLPQSTYIDQNAAFGRHFSKYKLLE